MFSKKITLSRGSVLALFLLVTIVGSFSSADAQTRTFNYPRIGGAIVDHCVTWATNCGWAMAHRYCRRVGYQRATNFRRFRPGTTYVVGSRRYCRGGHCTGFSSITCTRGFAPQYRYKSRWDKIGGPGGGWTTGWVYNHTAPICGHYASGCSCYGRNYCGNYRSGQWTYWWPRGCRGPRWRIRCTSRRQ